jgi:LytS/YehU family sensor histidine kinase
MEKIKKIQRQIKALFSRLEQGNYKNRIPLEKKIENLYNDLRIEKERYNKEMESKYWQNESTY